MKSRLNYHMTSSSSGSSRPIRSKAGSGSGSHIPSSNPYKKIKGPVIPPSFYKQFLDNQFANIGANRLNPPNRAYINGVRDVDLLTQEGNIQNEIAKKAVNLGTVIDRPSLVDPHSPLDNQYGSNDPDHNDNTFLRLKKAPLGANFNPAIVAHELIHANDHQHDNLNQPVWRHLEDLHNSTVNPNVDFPASVRTIQNQLDPTGVFARDYAPNKPEVINHINRWRGNQVPAQLPFVSALLPNDWNDTFPEMAPVLNDRHAPLNKRPFFLGSASEYPAFMSERLHQPWDTGHAKMNPLDGTAVNQLTTPEARFVRNTLNEMDRAYSPTNYPTMNQHIRDRRNSVEGARGYTVALARGGHVTSREAKRAEDSRRTQQLISQLSELLNLISRNTPQGRF